MVAAEDLLAPPDPRVPGYVALDPAKCHGTPDFSLVLWACYLVASDSGVPLTPFRYLCAYSQSWSPELVSSPRLCVCVTSDLCLQIETVLLDLQATLLTLGRGQLSSNEYVPASAVSWSFLHIRMPDNSV